MRFFKLLASILALVVSLGACGSSAIVDGDFPPEGVMDGGASGGDGGLVADGGFVRADGGTAGGDGGTAGGDGGAAGDDGGAAGGDGGAAGGDGGAAGGDAAPAGGDGRGAGGDGGAAGGDGGTAGGDGGAAGGDGGTVVPTLTSISVTPAANRLVAGTTIALRATGLYSNGSSADLSARVAWTSDSPTVASVSATGAVQALTPGTATIAATFGAVRGLATVTVTVATITSIALTPATASTGVQGTVPLRAVATLSDGTTQQLTPPTVAFVSNDPRIATVSADGLVTGVSAGTVSIVATAGGQRATATITVNPASLVSIALTPTAPTVGIGVSVAFRATGNYSDGTVADLTGTATWTSSAPQVASIGAAGVATSLAAGTTTITATSGGVRGTTPLTVSPATLTALRVTPPASSLAVRGTVTLTATGAYSDGTTADLTRTATWSSSAAAVASVSSADPTQGTVQALAPGMTTITARVGAVSGTSAVTVLAATLTSLVIVPAMPTVPLGGTTQLTARGTYSDGSVLDVTRTVTWAVDSAAVATVSNATGSQGVVSGVAMGGTTVRATLDGRTATAALTVSGAGLSAISISPATPSLQTGERLPLTATATYSDRTTADVTASVVWATTDARIATVSNASGAQGQLTAVAVGSTAVTATLNGVAGTTTVTVSAATLTSLTVSPISPSVPLGQPVSFSATAIFSNGTQQNVTLQASWVSSNPTVAAVFAGQTRTQAAGQTIITASYRGLSGSSTLTVTRAVPVSLSLSPITPSLPAGTQVAFRATAILSDDTSVDVTGQATWTSSSPNVLGINTGGGGGPGGGGRGVATGLSAGTSTVTATFSGFSASTVATVTAAVPVSLVVAPAVTSGSVGTTRQFQATAIYSDNTSRDVTGQATWVSSAPSIVGVTTGGGGGPGGGGLRGLATALAAGSATITASWSGLDGAATFTVTAATLVSVVISPAVTSAAVGTNRQLTAQALYSDNTSTDVTGQATWVSSAPAIAAVSDAGGGPGGGGGSKGLVTAVAMGSATISASFGGRTGTAPFVVTAATITAIQVTPIQPSVSVGTPLQFTATAIYSDNTTQAVTGQATWISSNPEVASVSTGAGGRGLSQTLGAGTTTITATYNGFSGSTVLTVTPARLMTIQVTPFAPTIPVGYTTRLAATGIYSDNTTQDLTGLATWTSSAPTVASVSSANGSRGVLSPLSGGTATITASYDGVSGTDLVTVADITLRAIQVTPATASVRRFASQAYTAVGTFSDGTQLDLTTYVTWLSSTPAVADISNAAGSQGLAKGLSAGNVTISAVRAGITGTGALTVVP